MDIAELGVRVTSTGIAEATTGLTGLAAAGDRASISAASFARSGASAESIARLTGVSAASAAHAVEKFGASASGAAAQATELAAAEQEASAATVELGAATGTASLGLGRLRQSMATLAAESLGMNPIVGRLGSTMAGAFGAGTLAVIALMAGVVAVRGVYNAWNEDAEKAQSEQDKLTDSLQNWYEKTKEGPAGDLLKQIDAMTDKVRSLRKELDGAANSSFFGQAKLIGAGGSVLDAAIRIFTAGGVTQMAEQAGVEVTKGAAHVAQQIKDGGAAIAAAKVEAAKRIADASRHEGAVHARDDGDALDRVTAGNAAFLASMQQMADESAALRVTGVQAEYLKHALEERNTVAEAYAKHVAPPEMDQIKATAAALREQADAQSLANKEKSNIDKAGEKANAAVKAQLDATTKAAEQSAQQQRSIVETYLKDEQRAFSDFFDNIFKKGIVSFTGLFNSIRDLFFKMVADMLAADVMKKLAGSMAAGIAGMLGMPAPAGAQGVSPSSPFYIPPASASGTAAKAGEALGMAGAGFGIGSAIGGFAQGHGLGMVGAGLGGAAGGAAVGAGIGALGGPIGVVAGAFVGGVAGAVGGLLGFTHSASQAAKALAAYQAAQDGIADSLAQWRAQITGTAADQKAAALLDLQVKYDAIQKSINDSEGGKKHEAQRNLDLAEASDLYNKNKTAIENNTAAWNQNTGAINAVQGYRYQADYYASMPIVPPPASSGGSNDPSAVTRDGSLTLNLSLDGTVLARAVLKKFQKAATKSGKDTTQWSEITTVN